MSNEGDDNRIKGKFTAREVSREQRRPENWKDYVKQHPQPKQGDFANRIKAERARGETLTPKPNINQPQQSLPSSAAPKPSIPHPKQQPMPNTPRKNIAPNAGQPAKPKPKTPSPKKGKIR